MSEREGCQSQVYFLHSLAFQTHAQGDCFFLVSPITTKALISTGNSELNTEVRLWEHLKAGNDSGTKRRGRCTAHTLPHRPGHGALFLPPVNPSREEPAQIASPARRCEGGRGAPAPPAAAGPAAAARTPALTAQHEQQHAGQRGHDHQQGQPDALPHGAAGGSRQDPGRASGPAPAPPPAAEEPAARRGVARGTSRWRGRYAGRAGSCSLSSSAAAAAEGQSPPARTTSPGAPCGTVVMAGAVKAV